MTESPVLAMHELSNGLHLELFDRSRHYFGGYWHLCLEACCQVPLAAAGIEDPARFEELRRQLGDPIPFVRRVEQMAVPPERVDAIRSDLQQRLLAQMVPLLEHPDFAARFVTKEYQQRTRRTQRGIPCLV